ncbi:MAG TPA: peptidyl-prolyl cis-trans isomerase [Metalysinibacillus jejuensis]|uniref:Peptidyl-prolyl cis-trans isomerase n=1 Tax=Metalysinibacillus jejuensis TaxID=914327 RepID=A0A921T4Q1_9BACL|nr:peptidyl-prolyl cis-trans isomerase [Metalysinibacillus jejuensis]
METIIALKGAVKYPLTLDPTVWIFDDRKVDLKTYFTEHHEEEDEDIKYMRAVGNHWSREIMEGATFPPTLKSERKFDRKGMQTGTFGIHFKHFLKNAEPLDTATTVVFETTTGQEHAFSLADAASLLFKYSHEGKPLVEDGPVHILFADGSNVETPITDVCAIRVQ